MALCKHANARMAHLAYGRRAARAGLVTAACHRPLAANRVRLRARHSDLSDDEFGLDALVCDCWPKGAHASLKDREEERRAGSAVCDDHNVHHEGREPHQHRHRRRR